MATAMESRLPAAMRLVVNTYHKELRKEHGGIKVMRKKHIGRKTMNHNEIDELRKNFGKEEKCLHEGTVKTLWTQNDAKVLEKTEAIEMAKSLITQFVMSTGMQNQRDGSKNITAPVFDDLHNILLAYKENKQRWPHRSIVVTADLIEFRINTVVDDIYFLRSEVFENLQHMVDDALSCLNFEKLVCVSDNEWGLIENTSRLFCCTYRKQQK